MGYLNIHIKIFIIILFAVLSIQNQMLIAQTVCIPVDTVCTTGTTDFFVNDDGTSTYTWSTNNGATLTIPPGDTLVMVDWSTSTVSDGLDSVCVQLSPTCTVCRVSYLEDCTEPDCISGESDPIIFCTYVIANPMSAIALADCDGGGINNLIECQSGEDPFDSSDDCQAAVDEGVDICFLLDPDGDGLYDASHPLASLDCDGGGIANITECQSGEDTLDPTDDCDDMPPTLVCPSVQQITGKGCSIALADYTTAVDLIGGCTDLNIYTFTQSPLISTDLPTGFHTITIMVTDVNNNSATCDFIIEVDLIPPPVPTIFGN